MNITINNQIYEVAAEQTILDAARQNSIFIPTLCHIQGLLPTGACGICIVEVQGVARLLRACATPVTEGIVISTDSPRVIATRKGLLELLLSTHMGDCVAPCRMACPAGTDCQGYTALIAQGRTLEAVRLMKEAHPFPASVARICPRPCESECRRKLVDAPVNLAGIKRYAADLHLDIEYEALLDDTKAGKKIAIIGGGPAGLTAAYFLRRAGHAVMVYEQMPKMGGLLQYGIPEYRLPKAIVDAELAALQKIGITFCNNWRLGTDATLEDLRQQNDAVILAIGAGASKPMWCKGEDAPGVYGGLDFLRQVASGNAPSIGDRVVVIGGSNTAMDTARTALRLGAKEVFVSYRRTRDEMPAEPAEVEEAIAEGVQFLFLTAPQEISYESGLGITLQKMTLGEPDASGRRRPVPMEGADEFVRADTIIGAIGQDVVFAGLEPLEDLAVDENYQTKLPGVYAIGDATGKSAYAIDAIAHGKHVATVIGARIEMPNCLSRTEKTSASFAHIAKVARRNAEIKHSLDFMETHKSLTNTKAQEEAARCLACGCVAYDRCQLLEYSVMYNADADKYPNTRHYEECSNAAIAREMGKCIHCYKCVQVCTHIAGEELLSAAFRGYGSVIDTAFNTSLPDECASCRKCVEHCPTGALS